MKKVWYWVYLVVHWLRIRLAGQGTRIPHAMKQLNQRTTTTDAACHNPRVWALQQKILRATTEARHSQID